MSTFSAPTTVSPGLEPLQSRRQLNQEQAWRSAQTRHQCHALMALPAYWGETMCIILSVSLTLHVIKRHWCISSLFSCVASIPNRGWKETDCHSDKPYTFTGQQLVSFLGAYKGHLNFIWCMICAWFYTHIRNIIGQLADWLLPIDLNKFSYDP